MRPRLAPLAYRNFRSQRSTVLALALGVLNIAVAGCASPAADNAASRCRCSAAMAPTQRLAPKRRRHDYAADDPSRVLATA